MRVLELLSRVGVERPDLSPEAVASALAVARKMIRFDELVVHTPEFRRRHPVRRRAKAIAIQGSPGQGGFAWRARETASTEDTSVPAWETFL